MSVVPVKEEHEPSPACPRPAAGQAGAAPSVAAVADMRGRAAGLFARTSSRYWTALALLVLSAAGLRTTAEALGLTFRKEAVPLKRPLASLDTAKLGPRYLINKILAPEPLSEDMVDSLGTEEYTRFYLVDHERRPEDSTRLACVFITYYTGKPDMVPHVPDECFQAGGYERLGAETDKVHVPGSGAPQDLVPVRVVRFRSRQRDELAEEAGPPLTVLYFFHVNGGYATNRHGVRVHLMNPFERYGYYCKIEVSFTNIKSHYASTQESLAALGPLLERLMPVLFHDHLDLAPFGAPAPAAHESE